MNDAGVRQCLYLISKGWNPDIVFKMDEAKRIAFFIILQEFEGGAKFNFNTMSFAEPKK